jgi:hypothetical protein
MLRQELQLLIKRLLLPLCMLSRRKLLEQIFTQLLLSERGGIRRLSLLLRVRGGIRALLLPLPLPQLLMRISVHIGHIRMLRLRQRVGRAVLRMRPGGIRKSRIIYRGGWGWGSESESRPILRL